MEPKPSFTVFGGQKRIATGTLDRVLTAAKAAFDRDAASQLLFFDDQSGRPIDFDLRGTLPEVLAKAVPATVPGRPGRPKLGVVSREISLLPIHWEWLELQPGGASAALRRLVDDARSQDPDRKRVQAAAEATSRFLSSMAVNLPSYEEACRALYAGSRESFFAHMDDWPDDIREHATRLARNAFLSPSG